MRSPIRFVATVLFFWIVSGSGRADASGAVPAAGVRSLSFEDRVACQREIERVYHRYRTGESRPFIEAAPLEAVESRVRQQAVIDRALEVVRGRPIEPEALARELERIAEDTLLPTRLREVYDALGNDRFLLEECLARPLLAERLARGRFESDEAAPVDHSTDLATVSGATGPPPRLREFGVASNSCTDDTWLPLFEPNHRAGHVAIWTGSEMIVWGGSTSDPTDVHASGRRYDPLTGMWRAISAVGAPLMPAKQVVWTGSEMILLGDRHPNVLGGGRYDPARDTWSPISIVGAPSAERSDFTAVWTGTEVLVWGGSTVHWCDEARQSGERFLATGARYDPKKDVWTPMTLSDAPTPRSAHVAVWTGDRMLVWGGRQRSRSLAVQGYCEFDSPDSAPTYAEDGGAYDPVADRWKPIAARNAPTGREDAVALWTGEEMLVWGGRRPGIFPLEGGRYDPQGNRWRAISSEGAPSTDDRDDASTAIWTGREMIVWNGLETTGGRYDPNHDSWQPIAQAGEPDARMDYTAVWSGTEMIVWGGSDGGGFTRTTGGAYTPATNSWRAIGAASPSARANHTAVWTGSEMIVWGGAIHDTRPGLSSGGRYDPMTDSWRATSTLRAPAGRQAHTAIWTGREMIVWGGSGDGAWTTGGRYDPVADSWVPTAMVGAPEGRDLHTAVWTGREMIVWGGRGNGLLTSGGRYDPVADAWTPTSTFGAPDERASHTAVWTGDEMIVVGGSANGLPLDTGGLYDPLGDAWEPIAESPWTMRFHTAVWTGSEVLVWGGTLNPGGRYDPIGDSWVATATDGAPVPAAFSTASWTGDEMIVIGGFRAGYDVKGGRYSPSRDSWRSVATPPFPLSIERSNHTAVLADGLLLIWGGRSSRGLPVVLGNGGAYAVDGDADGLCLGDNCPVAWNPDQADSDADGIGDACEGD